MTSHQPPYGNRDFDRGQNLPNYGMRPGMGPDKFRHSPPPQQYPPPYGQGFEGPMQPPGPFYGGSKQFIPEPVADVAMLYGSKFVDTGKQYVREEIKNYFTKSGIKFYFTVDSSYVLQKLKLLLFPFTHKNWSLQFRDEHQLTPKDDINAPDLYIPSMAYVTYVLVAGLIMGVDNRFTPESLGILASRTLALTLAEVFLQLMALYLMNVTSHLKYLDLFAFSGYKFVGIILASLSSLMVGKLIYYLILVYFCVALDFFLLRSLSSHVLRDREDGMPEDYGAGLKRKKYFLLSVATFEPILMWWLSFCLL